MNQKFEVPSHLLHGVVALSIALIAGCGASEVGESDAFADERRFNWKLVTSFPPNLPVNHETVHKFAEDVEVMSRGRLKVQVFAGGELIPALQVFDAVSQGSVELAHSGAYYWAGKVPAAQFMAAVPFGMTHNGMWAWLYGGEGLDLWRELYEPFGVIPFPMGNTGIQMGGWFNKKVASIDDLKGLKMRIPGLGGKVLAEAGGNPVLLSAAEIYTALERGTIDATEWVGPLHDVRFGLDRAAKYYYYPGWHEPGTQLELLVNAKAWAELPPDLQKIIENAAAGASLFMYGMIEVENAKAFRALKDSGHVELIRFPPDVLKKLSDMTETALAAEAEKNGDFTRIWKAYETFRADHLEWEAVTEKAYRDAYESVRE
jgi:TRAP-type mannitol/chloroaromatic compound transport system substrate-binding protein